MGITDIMRTTRVVAPIKMVKMMIMMETMRVVKRARTMKLVRVVTLRITARMVIPVRLERMRTVRGENDKNDNTIVRMIRTVSVL